MSQSTRLFTTINFAGKTYNSLNDVRVELQDIETRIEDLKSNLRVLAYMTEPNKMKPEDATASEYLDANVNYLYSEFEELFVKRYKLEMLIEEWDKCHNNEGLGINPPDDVKYKSFIDGDFVYTEKHPTKESLLS
jgi:hypothetical protein